MPEPLSSKSTFLSRLLQDRSGNTLAIVAAAIAPLLAITGSAVDIGRGYVTESRLQQACDAGVLAARKTLGSDLPPSSKLLDEVRTVGNDFFDLNFPDERYGTESRSFVMTLEEDFAISGRASVILPTAIMRIFGKETIDVGVACQSRMNFTNLDVMMVLDVTGSMRNTNDGDSMPRIDVMRSVIKEFHGNLEASKAPDTRVRYGFVPYSTNVNIGSLLQNDWVVDDWTYQSRELSATTSTLGTRTYTTNWATVSGARSSWATTSTYEATFYPATSAPDPGEGDAIGGSGTSASYKCEGTTPSSTIATNETLLGETSEVFVGPPPGIREIDHMRRLTDGARYRTRRNGTTCIVEEQVDADYIQTYDRVTDPKESIATNWRYAPISRDVSSWRTTATGCMEEVQTTEISDFTNVDLSQAMDLDIDHIPNGSDSTKWRPSYPDIIYARSLSNSGNGSFTTEEVVTSSTFAQTGKWWMSACPASAVNLSEMNASALSNYLDTLTPQGATYHDIGMLWGARLLSPSGIFASENTDVSADKPTTRHMIFLTDGQTEAYDVAYGAYGIEGLDRRRWSPESPMTLTQTIENRFLFACKEAKKKNITMWIIAFGTTVNPTMTECAGDGHYFTANSASELDNAFSSIARSMGDLRVSK